METRQGSYSENILFYIYFLLHFFLSANNANCKIVMYHRVGVVFVSSNDCAFYLKFKSGFLSYKKSYVQLKIIIKT